MHDEFEMSMMGELNFFLGLQMKQMEDDIFFNQSKYIKEMLKKFGLEDSKPMKTPMTAILISPKDEEIVSLYSSTKAPNTFALEALKRSSDKILIKSGIKGTTHLGLWYPKGTGIETVVYDSDHAGDYVDRKSTSVFVRSWDVFVLHLGYLEKQTDLAISTTEAEYVSAEKACQQALWMKQALIDYDVRLEDVPIMCDNKGAIDLSKNPCNILVPTHQHTFITFFAIIPERTYSQSEKVSSVDNIATILTKPLKREKSFGVMRELSDRGSPRVIIYGYNGLSMQPVAPPSPDYVPGLEHPPSPDYVPGPEHPTSPVEVPYVPEPEYPEYLGASSMLRHPWRTSLYLLMPHLPPCHQADVADCRIMNPQETQQVAARDEKWVPSAERAFIISADIPEIFMQQFWYTIKKVQDTDSYEFLLANKKCTINDEVFRTILDIYPRVEGVDFTDVPYDDTTLTFLIDLGYKGPLNRHTNMFVDHMHQP
ncbi:retrovirus-related pol polyprotein from transposon TNT 1-94 [Tanacetum coccineum]